MKKVAIIIPFLFVVFNGMSQDSLSVTDSNYYELLRALKTSDTDSARLQNLISLGYRHQFSRPDSGIYYATKGFELARALGDNKGELRALGALTMSHESLGNSVTAYRIALEDLRKAEEYDPDRKGNIYRSLGIIMRRSQRFEDSRQYFEKARDEFYRINNLNGLATVYASLGVVHSELGNIDSALYYGYRAIALAESLKATIPMDVAYDRIGDTYWNLKNLDSALHYYKLSYATRSVNRKSPFILRKIAQMYSRKEEADSTLFYAEESLNKALANSLYQDVVQSALFLSEFYETSDLSRALRYNKMALAYKDSLEYMSKMTGFADLTNFDELLRQSELARVNQEYQAKLRTNTFIGSITTLLIVAFFLYRNNRANNKSKRQIEAAFNQLKATQSQLIHAEKMASLGELTAGIAHEIQNPLNFVNNFSEVSEELVGELQQAAGAGNTAEVQEIAGDLKENLGKIHHHGQRASEIVKGMLAHSRSGDGKKELTDVNKLADEYLRLAYHGLRAKDNSFNADFKLDLDETLPKIEVVPQDLGRVLLNLINNAFQAVKGHENPHVRISTWKNEDHVEINVEDNGPGIPNEIRDKIFQPFFTTKPAGEGTGLGLSLSYDIIRSSGGQIEVESTPDKGSRFTIRLPLKKVNV